MSNKYCGKCGNIIREKSKFCSRCGSRILPRVDTLIPTELNSTPSLAERKKWAKISSRPLLKVLLISTVILVTLGWFVLRLPPVRLALYRNSASAEINDLADKSGLNSLGMLYFYSSNPKLVSPDILNKVCPKVDIKSVEYGCYLPSSNDMYILKVTNIEYRQIENVSVAHETLHAIWQDSSPSERTELKKELSAVYNS
ncbi:zinc ribbon domain-containing protein, partial [Candidatus Saccharibacteria bacterium]|nr:zinc ribbon domain-containing protein [Candidatus Saccharibacteria bacterium]